MPNSAKRAPANPYAKYAIGTMFALYVVASGAFTAYENNRLQDATHQLSELAHTNAELLGQNQRLTNDGCKNSRAALKDTARFADRFVRVDRRRHDLDLAALWSDQAGAARRAYDAMHCPLPDPPAHPSPAP